MIPRWRRFTRAAASGELDPLGLGTSPEAISKEQFLEKAEAWNAEKDLISAAELVGAAIVVGKESDVVSAARQIVEHAADVRPAVHAVAIAALRRAGVLGGDDPPGTEAETSRLSSRQLVRTLRRRIRLAPRNPILLVDLSCAYAEMGQVRQAIECMEGALSLARENRFVVRSAARLFAHIGDVDRAYDVVSRTHAMADDPWLMASNIAIATMAEKPIKAFKRGLGLLGRRRFSARETSELAAALATAELRSGKDRQAKKLFRLGLVDPNDNTVAQAEWASRRLNGVHPTENQLSIRTSFEARAWHNFHAARWTESLNECRSWLADERYSVQPAVMGSYVAASLLEDYEEAIEIASEGLRANPTDSTLLNNAAFALARMGRTDEAATYLDRADPGETDPAIRAALAATTGLVAFRRGSPERGRTLYLQALEMAQSEQLMRARLNLAREELLAGTPGARETLVAVAAEAMRSNTEDIRQIARLVTAAQESLHR